MKRLKYLVSILFIFLTFSCNEDFLERPPFGSLSEGTFPSTEQDAILATNGCYNILRNWFINTGGYPVLDIMSDDGVKGSNPGDGIQINVFDNFTFTPSESVIVNWWRTLYQGIRRTNLVIERVPSLNMDQQLKNRLVGEARFLRAYFYSLLVMAFGDVPKVTTVSPPLNLGRAPKEEIYNEIIFPDLLFAAENLPVKSDYGANDLGRATKSAAKALLARIYLFTKDFQNTEKYSLEVINSGQYSLDADFSHEFSVEGEHGSGSIFEISSAPFNNVNLGGNQYGETQGVRGIPNLGWGFNRPSYDLIKSFETNDPRMDATILFTGETLDGITIVGDGATPDTTYTDQTQTAIQEIETYNQKVFVPGTATLVSWGHNRRVIRYADVLLMAAEALNEDQNPTDALIYLNKVRERARGGNPGVLPDIVTTDQDELREMIWEERRHELAMEGLRFWDIIRTGRGAEILGPLGFREGINELFPIPQSEIDISEKRITQNPGY